MEQLDLSSFCKTKAQAHDFTTRIAAITEKIYETSFALEPVLQEILGMKKKDLLMTLIHKENINTDSAADLKKFFLTMQDTLIKLPVITLTIAFEPQETTLQVLSDWFSFNLKKQVLFDIETNTQLIAGAKIKYNGTYADFSVKPLFDKMLSEYITQTINQ
jgi:F0F1-type ATP synthase delta subunit